MNTSHKIVICKNCGAKNRVPIDRMSDKPMCGKCHSLLHLPLHDSKPLELTDATFEREVLSYPGPVVVDFWAPWCGPCRMVAPSLERLASKYNGRAKVAKLNVDENPTTAAKYQIQSIPTMLFFKNGKLVDRVVGAIPLEQIEVHLRAIL